MAKRTPARRTAVREAAAKYEAAPKLPMGEVFWLLFKELPDEARNAFLSKLLDDPDMREDVGDYLVYLERKHEPSQPFEEFTEEMRREGLL